MKVKFLLRRDALTKLGGDTIQIKKYIEELNKLGVTATMSTNINPSLDDIDIVHLVNIDRPLETWHHFLKAKKLNKKIVISPIHHSYSSIDLYERSQRTGILKLVSTVFKSYSSREKIKNIYRGILKPGLLGLSASQLIGNLSNKQKTILQNVDYWCLIANGEREMIEKDFDIKSPGDKVIYNGINLNLERNINNYKKYDVLVVGRIESRKNQIGIIHSLQGTGLRLAFLGNINRLHKSYVKEFLREIDNSPNAVYLGAVSHDKMPEIYGQSKVHLSASWFEVASLVDIEALYYGCNVVSSTQGFTKEYLGDLAQYIDPGDKTDIRNKVLDAVENIKYNNCVQDYIISRYSWERAGRELLDVYSKLV